MKMPHANGALKPDLDHSRNPFITRATIMQPLGFAILNRPRHVWQIGLSLCLLAPCISAQITATNNRLMLIGPGGITQAAPARSDLGRAMAVGDFDCDGFDDVAIGNPRALVNGAQDAGQVLVLYGSRLGLNPGVAEGWSQSSPNVPGGSEVGDAFGSSVAAGKLSNDGCDDLAIGAPQEALGDPVRNTAGAVTTLLGSPSGLTATGAIFLPASSEDGDDGIDEFDRFGSALAIGNIYAVGSSFDELIIGVPRDKLSFFASRSGSIDIRRASGSPLNGRVGRFSQESGSGGESNEDFDQIGRAVTVGNFDGDSLLDVAFSAPGETLNFIGGAGAVSVIYGSAPPFTQGGSLFFHQGSDGVPGANEANDEFGTTLAAGDFDGDGDDELVIGVPQEDLASGFNQGMIVVRNGRSNGVNGFGSTFAIDAVDVGAALSGEMTSTQFGSALAVGDFNLDGFDDLSVGAEDSGTGGLVVVLYGSASGLSAANRALWNQNTPGVAGAANERDFFGAGLAAGDFNDDGASDLLVGIPGEVGAPTFAGAVQVFYGRNKDIIFANGLE